MGPRESCGYDTPGDYNAILVVRTSDCASEAANLLGSAGNGLVGEEDPVNVEEAEYED